MNINIIDMRLKQDQINEIINMKNNNISNSEIIDKYKISKATFFRIINKRKVNNNLNDIVLNDTVISNSNNDISTCKNY